MDTTQLTTQLTDDINKGIDFGKIDTKKTFLSFSIKILLLLIPGIILGYYIDKIVKDLYDKEKFGKNVFYYICIQTLLSLIVLYILSYFSHYTDEFQNTFAGLYFTAFFFGMQTHYTTYLQIFLG
jgi:hypothetical protein